MEEMLKSMALWISVLVEFLAVVIIGLSSAQASIRAIALYFHLKPQWPREEIRLQLGKWLVLALELTVAADIMRTAVAPTWDAIGKLAAVITLRTALNYFLQQELAQAEQNPPPGSAQG